MILIEDIANTLHDDGSSNRRINIRFQLSHIVCGDLIQCSCSLIEKRKHSVKILLTISSKSIGLVSLNVTLSFFTLANQLLGVSVFLVFLQIDKQFLVFNGGDLKLRLELFKLFLHDLDLRLSFSNFVNTSLVSLDLSINHRLSVCKQFFHSGKKFEVTCRRNIVVSSQLLFVSISQLCHSHLHIY